MQHDHEYLHEHNIPHVHHPDDVHDEAKAHLHSHEHAHDHACGEHIHCGENVNCADCGHAHVSPREELIALMKYMVGHNAAHANELAQLAKQLQDMGENVAYEQVMQAVSDFEKGNMRLSTVLAAMNG